MFHYLLVLLYFHYYNTVKMDSTETLLAAQINWADEDDEDVDDHLSVSAPFS